MSADAKGGLPPLALSVFRFIDSVMARRELIGIYASGESAGSPGKERARHWHRVAVEAGLAQDAIGA